MSATYTKEEILKAKRLATDLFNELPFETRQKLANPADRLTEIEILLSKGDSLCLAYIKKRKKALEEWLIDWYKEITDETRLI